MPAETAATVSTADQPAVGTTITIDTPKVLLSTALVFSVCAAEKDNIVTPLVDAMNTWLPKAGIILPIELAHFLGQSAVESAYFTTLTEFASGEAYEGRRDLGNTEEGDGRRFKGRGIFETTGRYNYEVEGRAIGVDLIAHPERAAEPEIAVRLAIDFWHRRNLGLYARRDDCESVSARINGRNKRTGLPNAYADRLHYTQAFKKALGL